MASKSKLSLLLDIILIRYSLYTPLFLYTHLYTTEPKLLFGQLERDFDASGGRRSLVIYAAIWTRGKP